MKRTISVAAALVVAAVSSTEALGQGTAAGAPPAGAAANAPPPAPAPGSPAIFRANADLMAALARSIATGNAMASTSVVLTDQYRASLIRRAEPNSPITHAGNTEMHYILEGSGTVVTGGTVVRPTGAPARIEGGEAHRVVKGDIVIVPASSPHHYTEIVEPITYLEFRFVAPE
jgi:mannose-6-phosphate isomerase-like protein (cupin superfamily)